MYIVRWNETESMPYDVYGFDTLAEARDCAVEQLRIWKDQDWEHPRPCTINAPAHSIRAWEVKKYGGVRYCTYGNMVIVIGWAEGE